MELLKFLFTISRARIAAVFVSGLISGVANTFLLLLIRDVIAPGHHQKGVTTFVLTGVVALATSVLSQVLLIRLTQEAVYELRVKLSSAVVTAPLERLERLGAHRLLGTLTDDVQALSHAVAALPHFCVDFVTIVGCLIALAVISGPVFTVTIAGILLSIVGVELLLRRVRRTFAEARDDEDTLLQSFHSVAAGIKELKLHRGRRQDFMDRHLLGAATKLRDKHIDASARATMAHGYGRLMHHLAMAAILFGVAAALQLPPHILVSYVLVTIFLSMPMQHFMSRIPDLIRGDVALNKIRAMDLTLHAGGAEDQLPHDERPTAPTARLELSGIEYTYSGERGAPSTPRPIRMPAGRSGPGGAARRGPRITSPPPPETPTRGFHLGPLNLTFQPGQISFIVGGNGSGKSTLAKLLTGLYTPESGVITLNDEPITEHNVEWFRQNCSAIFSDFHLFDECLGLQRPGIDDEVRHYLQELQLAHHVTIDNGRLSTVALSQGQRKRLALLTALLEDRPIYVFDEWAADQEPQFRDVFYTELLPQLAHNNKTIIVITHDDRYFHYADQIVKLDYGQLADQLTDPLINSAPAHMETAR